MNDSRVFKPAVARALRGTTIILLSVALGACASFEGIHTTAHSTDPRKLGAQVTPVDWPADAWWKSFNDPQLDQLIEQALAHNPSLGQARTRLVSAQAALSSARAILIPQVTGEADFAQQRYSENGLFPPPIAGSSSWNNTLSLNLSWELDFWGRNRAAIAAAGSQVQAGAADLQAARVLIASSVARSYFQLARLSALHDVLVETRDQREQSLAIVNDRVRAGLDNNLPLRQAEGALPQTRADLEAVDESRELTRHALAALIGEGPEFTATLAPPMAAVRAPVLPAAIPIDLIGRRADIVAARWRVEAAAREIDFAKAEFYPNVNLTAFAGLNALGLGHLFETGSRAYGVGPAIRLPIFNAGNLRSGLQVRTAEFDAAVENYNSTLLDAVRDVADQISSTRSLAVQQREHEQAEAAARSAYELALQRYKSGLDTFLTVLIAQDTLIVQRRTGTELKARALDLNVSLIRSLGGGFVDESKIASASQQ